MSQTSNGGRTLPAATVKFLVGLKPKRLHAAFDSVRDAVYKHVGKRPMIETCEGLPRRSSAPALLSRATDADRASPMNGVYALFTMPV